jgi:uncharacterized protein
VIAVPACPAGRRRPLECSGGEEILGELARIARVTAVRGNNDTGPWAAALPETQALRLGGIPMFVLHDLKDLKIHPPPDGTQVVICGHSHKAQVLRLPSGPLVINPGSAGPRRFKPPVTAAELAVTTGGVFEPRIVSLLQAASV